MKNINQKTAFRILLAGLIVLFIIFLGDIVTYAMFWAMGDFTWDAPKIDHCLDSSGCWNYETRTCQYVEACNPPPQQ